MSHLPHLPKKPRRFQSITRWTLTVQLAALSASLMPAGCRTTAPQSEQLVSHTIAASLADDIRASDLHQHVSFLASEECEGRLTGTPGAERAAGYIADRMKQAGLKPAAGGGTYDQPFDFAAGVRRVASRNRMEVFESSDVTAGVLCQPDVDFRPLTYSANGGVEGDVVFAGYGLVEPQASADSAYDAYANLDVEGKIVLALRDLPEDVTPERRQQLALYAGDRYKAKLSADRGAAAFLLVVGPNSPNAGQLLEFHTDDRTSSVPIPALSITGAMADRFMARSNVDLKSRQDALDGGIINPHVLGSTGARIKLETGLKRVRKSCQNVIGVLPPTGGCDEYVMIGAHYDHIGYGEGLGSMAKQDEKGMIHYGADDNASGTSVVLELAASLAEVRRGDDTSKPQRGIIFACWSGEELGLVGSSHYVNHPTIPLDKTVAYFNFDMVGRLRNDKLILQSVGSSPYWRERIERFNDDSAAFDLVVSDDPYLPTDSTAFYTKRVPALAFFTDLHEEYNRPTDKAETLNYAGMERIARFAQRLVEDVADANHEVEYARIERARRAPGRMGMRAYTGVVPDFAGGSVKGVLLADVRPGGPAEQAGLKGGDVIVEFIDKKILNLQDYADALRGVKIGQEVSIVIERDGQRIDLTLTPTTRPE